MRTISLVSILLTALAFPVQASPTVDPESIISELLRVDSLQRVAIGALVMDAEYLSGKYEESGFVEAERFEKRLTMKFLPDTTWYHEEFLRYFKDQQPQDSGELRKASMRLQEEAEKRKNRNISAPMLRPFTPAMRSLYRITYQGIAEKIDNQHTCHHFDVRAIDEIDSLINGTFYFDIETHHLVRAEFTPAKLVKKMMFRMSELRMSITYAPGEQGHWLPKQFELTGKGKAALFIGVRFAVIESYRNHRIGIEVPDDFFRRDAE